MSNSHHAPSPTLRYSTVPSGWCRRRGIRGLSVRRIMRNETPTPANPFMYAFHRHTVYSPSDYVSMRRLFTLSQLCTRRLVWMEAGPRCTCVVSQNRSVEPSTSDSHSYRTASVHVQPDRMSTPSLPRTACPSLAAASHPAACRLTLSFDGRGVATGVGISVYIPLPPKSVYLTNFY